MNILHKCVICDKEEESLKPGWPPPGWFRYAKDLEIKYAICASPECREKNFAALSESKNSPSNAMKLLDLDHRRKSN